VESETPLDVAFASSSGVSIGAVTGVSGTVSGPFDSQDIEIPAVDVGAFVATVATPVPPPLEYGPGSIFKNVDSYARIPVIPAYSFGDFTMEFWSYIYSSPTPTNAGRFIDNNFGAGFAIDMPTANRAEFIALSAGIGVTSDPGSILFNQWNHLAFRRSGTTFSILLNGVVIKSGACSATTLNPPNFIYIGGPAEPLQSNTSDFRMWNVARSDADILANYQLRLVGDEAGLVAYYPIFETDSLFEDYTGNNADLLLMQFGSPSGPIPGYIIYDSLTPPCYPP
jgi:hypothetical protein